MTVPVPLRVFMGPHIRRLSTRFRITLVARGTAEEVSDLLSDAVSFEPLAIERSISLGSDLRALLALIRLFRRKRFAVVQSMMPKAGLLAMTAAAVVRIPVRIHWFTGQVWSTRTGAGRALLRTMDRVLARCATHLFADSVSQRQFLIDQGVVRPGDVQVLGQGSVCGVDTLRFRPDLRRREETRARLGIDASAVVALYLGRLNEDKGIPELAEAFSRIASECPTLHLVLVGPDEAGMRQRVRDRLAALAGRVHLIDFTNEPEVFHASADFFVLPSHREGFGSSVIESAACGVPAIGTKIYGLVDAIVAGETGLLVPANDPAALAAAMTQLAQTPALRLRLGRNALERVHRDFSETLLVAELMRFYDSLALAQEQH